MTVCGDTYLSHILNFLRVSMHACTHAHTHQESVFFLSKKLSFVCSISNLKLVKGSSVHGHLVTGAGRGKEGKGGRGGSYMCVQECARQHNGQV